MKASQMREYLIRPVLQSIDGAVPYSKVAEDLLLATACAESHCGEYIKQRDNGPAEGFFQMEPSTDHDIWLNYLSYRPNLTALPPLVGDHNLIANLDYATFMARIQYYRVSEPLPKFQADAYDYLKSLGQYWKKYYNTMAGKGTIEGFITKALKYGDFE